MAGEVTTPALVNDVTVKVRSAMRTPDELTTLLLDVTNEGNEDDKLDSVFRYDGVPAIALYDPAANVEYRPLQIDDDVETGGCLCTTGGVTVRAGETVQPYATFAGLDVEVDEVQVRIAGFTPLAGVPVLDTGEFVDGTGKPMAATSDDDLSVSVESVSPTTACLVRLRYSNAGSAPASGGLRLPRARRVQPGRRRRLGRVLSPGRRQRAGRRCARPGQPGQGRVGAGRGRGGRPARRHDVGDRPAPGVRRSFLVLVAETSQTPKVAVPDGLDDEEIYDLHSPTARLDLDMVPNARPDLPEVDDAGPPPVPRWSTPDLRGPARLVDRGGPVCARATCRRWSSTSPTPTPTATGPRASGPESTDDLGGITVVDPAGKRLYGAYQAGGYGLGAGETFLSAGESAHFWTAFPPSATTCPG